MYDAIVVGAGPGGATAAAFMADAGLRVLLLDKSSFPRDKICGDAISGKSVDVLRRLGMIDAVQQAEQVGSWGVTFSGPYGDEVAIPFTKELNKPVAPGFVCAREVYDDLLFQRAVRSGAEVSLNTTVEGLIQEAGRVVGVRVKRGGGAVSGQRSAVSGKPKLTADSRQPTAEEVRAPLVVGADGAYSVVTKSLGMAQLDEKHYCAGVRAYYEGVTGFNQYNNVELHFLDEAIPGYFWIFPMANGRANVGVGMLSASVKKKGVKLKELMEVCIQHPRFRERFADARMVSPVKGWGLPLGSKPRRMHGDGWVLVGDAASLIDPFTGEGIGNAMVSGEKAAEWALKAKAANDYSAAFLKGYEQSVLRYLQNELRLSHTMQRLVNWKWLLNTVIRKASRSKELAEAISCMFDDEKERQKLANPMFYLRVLTA